ncbi:hypothetical protein AtNW77_Chr1g0050351 [Arabidopsis thaliana]|uniref:Uncharacterized protein n=2 Tax=Arabidopsis TaxID=3701 RepID=A0A8T2GPQ1_9BRAS|nr:hypothetical protein ISN45_At01g042890 [Arabidopsis thaliana x Arabidopsis arenosa]OAP19563.1 hypothetical protein AXX17_AT1G45190 [Arabidopsis thaliana]CAA0285404.1 unnamed protein product [Arabidopsis thaliana]CAD5315191.1 unnamed protein product [Arabidopsis thaliana]VYS48724.1 unnamed protein product [Arabidopsis thaliana]
MANIVGNTSVSTRFKELIREMTQLNEEIQKIDVNDFGAIREARKKITGMTTKLDELLEMMKETVKEKKETPQ